MFFFFFFELPFSFVRNLSVGRGIELASFVGFALCAFDFGIAVMALDSGAWLLTPVCT